jgi:predicted phosphodiesterase
VIIKYVSDLHLEFGPFKPEKFSGDVLILAGDITTRCNPEHLEWIANQNFEHIVYIFGNHEYYHGSIEVVEEETREYFVRFPHVHVLQNESVIIEGISFHGCTLWTDFYGHHPLSMLYAEQAMSDFRIIMYDDYSRPFLPKDSVDKFYKSMDFLRNNVKQGDFVITHHAPTRRSISPRFKGDPLNPAFVNNLDNEIATMKPDYWIHGHTHSGFRYDCHDTKVLCNPRGYHGFEEVDDFKASQNILVY